METNREVHRNRCAPDNKRRGAAGFIPALRLLCGLWFREPHLPKPTALPSDPTAGGRLGVNNRRQLTDLLIAPQLKNPAHGGNAAW